MPYLMEQLTNEDIRDKPERFLAIARNESCRAGGM